MDKRIDEIIENLKEVYDPEIPVNVYDLGMIYSVDVKDDVAYVVMTLTAPNCPAADMILEDVKYSSEKTEGIKEAKVELTFEPAWDKSMMSEEARLELGFM
ncbi:iron-sulfur cluster assembly protein [Halosquirtibacter xylanolyticus]|uniref:metal-sulfur cluster assembly factor n=1 Tax=Halosquirtibacter xylanolyticus TaxID=3374599 RepID=UPI0037486902|nr:iron-sulfur cluster assembly protein [Prolixibacteraceae bacterium]